MFTHEVVSVGPVSLHRRPPLRVRLVLAHLSDGGGKRRQAHERERRNMGKGWRRGSNNKLAIVFPRSVRSHLLFDVGRVLARVEREKPVRDEVVAVGTAPEARLVGKPGWKRWPRQREVVAREDKQRKGKNTSDMDGQVR
jgi:hypothetical protein